MKKIKLLVASVSEIYCRGLAKLMEDEPSIKVVCTCCTGLEAVKGACKHRPDVIIIDTALSECNGIEAIQRIYEKLPETSIIAFNNSDEDADLIYAVKAGAIAYISMNIRVKNLVKTIALVVNGEVVVSPPMATGVLRELSLLEKQKGRLVSGQSAILSKRERAVLHLVRQGFTNREIAERLFISEYTVKVHVRNIMGKFNAHSAACSGLSKRKSCYLEHIADRLITLEHYLDMNLGHCSIEGVVSFGLRPCS